MILNGFAQNLHAEWTKFRTVRGWVVSVVVAALMVVAFALLAGVSSDQRGRPAVPTGPGGEPVTDSFYFVHRPLTADGSITVSVAALGPGAVPWAKAGLIVKADIRQGSAYAAIMLTGSHGIRMQDDYVNDIAGSASPGATAWLRLERSGDTITGYDSPDGKRWTAVGTVHLSGLGSAVQAGLFVASPQAEQGLGTSVSEVTATFGEPLLQGRWGAGTWAGEQVGAKSPTFAGYPGEGTGSFTPSGDTITVTGAGDIAPAVRESLPTGGVAADLLFGAFPALVTVIVVGTLFASTEFRDDLISATLAASPRRTRVLMAKAVVLGTVTFVAGLAATLLGFPLGERLARAHGVYLFPISAATRFRVELGTAALMAVAAVLALAVGAVLRRGSGAVSAVAAAIVLPYLLVANPFMPVAVSSWLTRVTPAAAFAVQQTLTPYHQVASRYSPYDGYYPLAPWAGLAVLVGYASVSLAVAAVLLRRRDV